jgi:hypothetical protein
MIGRDAAPAAPSSVRTGVRAAEPIPLRRIWLVADDYGIAPGVNRAIRDLVARGRINGASVMVAAPSFDRSEARALDFLNSDRLRVAIGLHLTLTAPFSPLSSDFRPVRYENFLPLSGMMAAVLAGRVRRRALAAEVRAQLAAFVAAFGRVPDFVDGHQHVHILPRVRGAVIDAVRECAPAAWLRQCRSARSLWQLRHDRKSLIISLLSQGFARQATAAGLTTNRAFAGIYEFRPDADYARQFPGFLEGLPEGGVIMCHPGLVDAELERLDPLTTLREREYAYFLGDEFPRILAAQRYSLALA